MLVDNYIDLEGTFNFRDFGGYKTKNNRKVVKGKLYRSDALNNLTEKDLEDIKKLNLSTIIDYRSKEERVNNENKEIEGARTVYITPIADIAALAASDDDKKVETLNEKNISAKLAKHLMTEQNKEFVRADKSKEVFRKMFDILLDDEETAIVQHCRGGKDRTGYGVALIQLLLGVSREDVMKDYMLTNVHKKEKNETSLKELMEETNNSDLVQAVRYFKEADPSFLETALDLIDDDYGGIENYVREELGMTDEMIEKLREKYLI